eukprot:GSChrysophyteH2.ASY1.ANO1.1662.1 assembled CDS
MDGYATLTNTVNTFAATQTCRKANTCSSSENYDYLAEGVGPFPSPEYTTTGFWGAVGDVFALLMIVVLLYPLANVISTLVREKESKLREGMKMMALKGEILWFSWWVNFMLLFLPLSLILTWAAYAIFISAFFTNSRTAAIAGSLLFFAGYFIYVGLGSSDRNSVMLAMLHPAAAFTYSTLSFSADFPVTFQECLNMLLVDAIYLSFLSWYVDKVWPSEFGTHEVWYFCVTPEYWKKFFGFDILGTSISDHSAIASNENVNVELISEDLQQQYEKKTCIDIQNLRKEFKTPQGTKVAVNGLTLSMFQGQITALLGHNGAGKTTAIAMLTGLIPADAGTAVVEGSNISENMEEKNCCGKNTSIPARKLS